MVNNNFLKKIIKDYLKELKDEKQKEKELNKKVYNLGFFYGKGENQIIPNFENFKSLIKFVKERFYDVNEIYMLKEYLKRKLEDDFIDLIYEDIKKIINKYYKTIDVSNELLNDCLNNFWEGFIDGTEKRFNIKLKELFKG